MEKSKSHETLLFIVLFAILVILEIIASDLSYENYGWSMEFIFSCAILLNIIPAIFYILKKKLVAIIFLIVIGILIIPEQFILANDLSRLREETANIANYSYRIKLKTGSFPKNINDYKFKYEDLKDRIDYDKEISKDDFEIWFCVGTRSTDHFYRHSFKDEKWYYYDD